MKFWTLALPLMLAAHLTNAQHFAQGVCGTDDVNIEQLKLNIEAAAAYAKTRPGQAKGAIIYIPIRFKLIGRADGTGEAVVHNVLNLLSSINKDFAPYEIQFFLDDSDGNPWDYYFNDSYYSNIAANSNFLRAARSLNAISVFVPDNATPPSSNGLGVTLGYYSPSQDLLVFKRTEIGQNASTASHEIGHYFNLPHTFRGWDCVSWRQDTCVGCSPPIVSPVNEVFAPCNQNIRNELVTRESGANCSTAGDLFCDTQADYNLGFGVSGCNYRGPVKDRNGDLLMPDENNFMGYFLGCNPYVFSEQQVAAMKADYRRAGRNFLRTLPAPNPNDTVVRLITTIAPTNNATTQFSNTVEISWEPVENASYYFLEVNTAANYREDTEIVSEILLAPQTSYTVTGLEASSLYFFRVRAFNELNAGNTSPSIRFRTGNLPNSISTPQAVKRLGVYPNPLSNGTQLTASLSTYEAGEFSLHLVDVHGRVISQQKQILTTGDNLIEVNGTDALPCGNYFLRVSGSGGVSTQRVVVQ